MVRVTRIHPAHPYRYQLCDRYDSCDWWCHWIASVWVRTHAKVTGPVSRPTVHAVCVQQSSLLSSVTGNEAGNGITFECTIGLKSVEKPSALNTNVQKTIIPMMCAWMWSKLEWHASDISSFSFFCEYLTAININTDWAKESTVLCEELVWLLWFEWIYPAHWRWRARWWYCFVAEGNKE